MERILHIIGKMDRAGAETMLMNLYRNIDRSKVQFDFVTFTYDKADYDDEIRALGGVIIPIVANNSLGRMLKLYQFLQAHSEYQTIHSHVLLNNAFHLTAAFLAGVKKRISHSHNTSNGVSNPLAKGYEIFAKKIINRLATHKIACGHAAANYLYNDDKNVLTLPNAVDVQHIHQTVEKSRVSSQHLFDRNKLNIIHVARFMPVKNHRFTLDIAEAMIEKRTDFIIHLVGDGVLRQEIEHQIRERNLGKYINLLGVCSNVIELMANADAMILPSLHEGFPVVLVESQAVGLPTLLSDTIAQEVDLNLGLVQFLPLNDAKDWALGICSLKKYEVSNEKILENLSNLGFDVSQNSKILEKIYTA